MLCPKRLRAEHRAFLAEFAQTDAPARRRSGFRSLTGVRASGDEFPIEASISQHVEGAHRFYTVILRDVSELMRTMDSLARSKDELRELASAAVSAREREQARVARELHDELAQSMSTLKMDVTLIRARASDDDGALRERLDRMDGQIDETIAGMRRIAADLRPMALDDLGLAAALQSLVTGFENSTGVQCRLSLSERLDLPSAHASAVFRIVQEALTNIRKHARASTVDVSVVVAGDTVHLSVGDDGVGFAQDGPRNPRSYGHLGVHERAYLLGGEAQITSSPGSGTRIQVSLPGVEAAAPAST
jgi:signal transduction histidine kinase